MARPGSRQAKDALFEALAGVAKALASGRRAEIVELLAQGERTVEQIAGAIGQSVANTSHHLRTLARAGLVTWRRDGTHVYYRLASGRITELWAAVRDVAEAHAEGIAELAEGYLGRRGDIEAITREELERRLAADDVILLDVRPALEYAAGHIPGARSVPLELLAETVDELPAGRDVVAYCRGPYCIYADQAVRLLTAHGRRAMRLREGYPEWRLARDAAASAGVD